MASPLTVRAEMLAFEIAAVAMDALETVAVEIAAAEMDALGMVATPVNVGFAMGAFNRFSESSAFLRSVISWFIMRVKSTTCPTRSVVVEPLPMLMPVMRVQL